MYALQSSYGHPPRVVRFDARTADQAPHHLANGVDEHGIVAPGVVERISATAEDGTPLGGWLVRPPTASAANPAPLVVFVHGGPLGSWNMWHWRWNPHILAERGYASLLPDPALSTGYGQQMLDRGWGQWGARRTPTSWPRLDGRWSPATTSTARRTALMGGSFGGYMANWVAGHTDRFKAIVTHASLWELRGFHGTTDHGPAWEREFGDPYVDPSRLRAQLAPAVPGRDGRCEDADARHPRRAGPPRPDLRGAAPVDGPAAPRRPRPFLYFPDENHWVLKPQNARLWYGTVLSFLDEHLCGKHVPARPAARRLTRA